MALVDNGIKKLKAKEKPYRKLDSLGLYLNITPKNKKTWLFRYTINKTKHIMKIGDYPEISLKKARRLRDEYRAMVKEGKDPKQELQTKARQEEAKRAAEQKELAQKNMTFKVLFMEWHTIMSKGTKWTKSHAYDVQHRVEKYVFPFIGDYPAELIKPKDIIRILKKMEAAGIIETLKRIHQYINKSFSYGVTMGYFEQNPAASINRDVFITHKPQEYPAITSNKELAQLLIAIDGYLGDIATKTALQLAPYVFLRPNELAALEWQEVDLKNSIITITAERMKKKRAHIVPLSAQAKRLIETMLIFKGTTMYVFPSPRTKARPINRESLNAGLKRLGFGGIHCAHGFRHTASTLLNEMGFNTDYIEKQLAHEEKNKVRGAYNKAQYLPQRAEMMQHWADYLDSVKTGANIIPITANKK